MRSTRKRGRPQTWPEEEGVRPLAIRSADAGDIISKSHLEEHDSEICGARPGDSNHGAGVRWDGATGCNQCATLIKALLALPARGGSIKENYYN